MVSKQSKLLLMLIVAAFIIGFFLYRDIMAIQKYIPHMIIISIIYGFAIYYYEHYTKMESVENSVILGIAHCIGFLSFLFISRRRYENIKI